MVGGGRQARTSRGNFRVGGRMILCYRFCCALRPCHWSRGLESRVSERTRLLLQILNLQGESANCRSSPRVQPVEQEPQSDRCCGEPVSGVASGSVEASWYPVHRSGHWRDRE